MSTISMRRLTAADPLDGKTEFDRPTAEALLKQIMNTQRPPAPAPRGWRTGKLILVAVALAVAVPSLAVARAAGLFGFGNSGVVVPQAALALDQVAALQEVGFAPGIRHLGDRAGVAFYVSRGTRHGLCFATGPAGGQQPSFAFLGCQRAGADVFPSDVRPIADFSPLRGRLGSSAVYVQRLEGVAADGVASVGVLAENGEVSAAVRVVNNLYVSSSLPEVPAKGIVALSADGRTLFTKPLESDTPG